MSKKNENIKAEVVEEPEVNVEVEEVVEKTRWEVAKDFLSRNKGKLIAGVVGLGAVAGGLYAANKYLVNDSELLEIGGLDEGLGLPEGESSQLEADTTQGYSEPEANVEVGIDVNETPEVEVELEGEA